MTKSLEMLRGAAMQAGGKKWFYGRTSMHSNAYIIDEDGRTVLNVSLGEVPAKYAAFIEAANPESILELINKLEREISIREQNLYIKTHMAAHIAELERYLRGTEKSLIAAVDQIAEYETRQLCVNPAPVMREVAPLCVKLQPRKTAEDYVDTVYSNEDLAMIYNSCRLECEVKIKNAGGTVEGE